jgi:hypothetical protein
VKSSEKPTLTIDIFTSEKEPDKKNQTSLKKIPLSNGLECLADADDYDRLSVFKWKYCDGYALRSDENKIIKMHREILGYPVGKEIDHIDRNRTNNAWNNLRVVDSAQNSWNAKKPNHVKSNTGIPGVKKKDNRYLVDISVRRRKVYVGCFKTLEEAAKARKAAVEKYHGEYAIRALISPAAEAQSQSDGSGNTRR